MTKPPNHLAPDESVLAFCDEPDATAPGSDRGLGAGLILGGAAGRVPVVSLALVEAPPAFVSSCLRRVRGAGSSTSETSDDSPEKPFLSESSVTGYTVIALFHIVSRAASASR